MKKSDMKPFSSYDELLAYVRSDKPVFYAGPLDYYASPVKATIKKGRCFSRKIKVTLPSRDCDSFIADETHLSRFGRRP